MAVRPGGKGDVTATLLSGAAVSALAYLTDYHVVPSRLTPGFEKRLGGRSLLAIYAALAFSLAAITARREMSVASTSPAP